MMRVSCVLRHHPLIQFKYAVKNGASSVGGVKAAVASDKSSSNVLAGTFVETFEELPKKFQPHLFTEEEMELIMMGGATPYVPKSLQRRKEK
ncbi:hypothetical protein TcYC6_0049940 [Trypanosoma cruzi]|nr:hypothetical protein TcBrA4_0035900 [Trypanosoma cruzi]KAF8301980.1 hypothetical protein TcYC6_0049940 [Trypanosoma cruzi]